MKGDVPGFGASDALARFRVQRRGQDASFDELAVESPLTILCGARPWMTLMRTPGHERALIAGLLRAEAIVDDSAQILGIDACEQLDDPEHEGQVYRVSLDESAALRLAQRRRSGLSASSCGICGKEQIEACMTQFPSRSSPPVAVRSEWVASLPELLRERQALFERSGAVHGAALFEPDSERPEVVREDVGRHNAVDKALGHCFWIDARERSAQWLVVSGRVSFEIVQKAAMHGCAGIVAVSAPTSLAVELARSAGLCLVGFTRRRSFVVYSGPERVLELGS